MKRNSILLSVFGWMMLCILFVTLGTMKNVMAEENDIFQVIFPSNTDHVFDFIMDPQELIRKTDAAAYGDLTFEEEATVFFRRYDGRGKDDYSSSSDALVIVNAGTVDVDITVSAGISSDSIEKIAMANDSTFEEDESASLYLALTDGVQTIPILEGEDAVLQITLAGQQRENSRKEYCFWLVGAVNRNDDWSKVQGVAPRVTVTWSATAADKEELREVEKESVINEITEEGSFEEEMTTEEETEEESFGSDTTEEETEEEPFGSDTTEEETEEESFGSDTAEEETEEESFGSDTVEEETEEESFGSDTTEGGAEEIFVGSETSEEKIEGKTVRSKATESELGET